ncbi:unnamed protein product [Sphenostylis stenocarpa]|uniref:Histidine decarboxylase n=1 Tax=Sphenostylis stenocarpa TaxID=92480 RepID=A0AA86W287_9FABA|nr:unnamed protein product [Sphenostylis stenocarpa]
MAFIPRTRDTELLSPVVSNGHISTKEDKLQIDIEEILPITECNGETQPKLDSIISHYIQRLNKLNAVRNTNDRVSWTSGYPENQNFNYGTLAPLLNFHLNNAGDPFQGCSFSLNSTSFEVCLLDWFANLWEIEKNQYWGYVTTGGTEGNLHGILVSSSDSGEINCDELKTLLLAHKDKPAIINLNIGTTMKGGVDDLDLVIEVLKECGFAHDRFYIHCDGALFGMMLPFIKEAPKITFKKPIGSIAISGHKFLGCPIPCGIVITRSQYMNALSRDVEYIASRDVTITGSRSGHAPIFLWYAIKRKGFVGLQNEVQNCIMNACHLQHRLRDAGIGAMLNKFSNIVVFERPLDEDFIRKWSLACMGNIAHVVVMQHVTTEILDSFVSEFLQKRSIWFQDGRFLPLCIADDVGSRHCACSRHNSMS